ncbi:hypothetical protein P8815_05315 [Bacillus altitudinis]|uniref:hypothetical protein n=1 Tax=Bacillus TaxID=1386 RepID=UPI000260AA19|nr:MULTISPECIES: hypothetical protein [Bacillus]EIL83088.1 hypothetical protein BAME_38170 [Bacillus sp. M 2-6]MEC0471157.1 hypothetical protein [Bacillus altitudinis]
MNTIPDFTKYPICDTNIWINLSLGDAVNHILNKHEIILFADVVEKEIMKFKNSQEFSSIATNFAAYKNNGQCFVIDHQKHIDPEVCEIMELSLMNLGFEYGLKRLERDKGEYVSAIYADEFSIPFMKTDDGEFRKGNKGNNEFPELEIKTWYDITEEYIDDFNERKRIRQKTETERRRLRISKEKYEESKKDNLTIDKLKAVFDSRRL